MIHNIPQPAFEEFVANELAHEPKVEMRKGVAFLSCRQVCHSSAWLSNACLTRFQDGRVVTSIAEERSTKTRWAIRSRHVVACDGARSEVRKYLGIATEGEDGCR